MITRSDLLIEGKSDIIEVIDYSMLNTMGAHPTAEIMLEVENMSAWKSFSDKNKIYKIKDKQSNKTIFAGYSSSVKVEKYLTKWKMHVKLIGCSSLLDRETKDRSFQEISSTNCEIVSDIISKESSFVIVDNAKRDSEIGKPLIQYEETNWAFAKRLASRTASPLYIRENDDTNKLYIGLDTSMSSEKDYKETFYSEGIDGSKFKRKAVPERNGYNQGDYYYYKFSTVDELNLGQQVLFNNRSMYVCEKKSYIEDEELRHEYKLVFKTYCEMPKEYNNRFSGATVLGTINESEGETIKINLKLKDEAKTGLYAYDWKPEAGNMMYCMPKDGTTVSLYFPDDDEQNAFAINCIRRDPSPGVQLDSDTKSFISEDKKILIMADKAFHLFTMADEEVATAVSLADALGMCYDSKETLSIKGNGVAFSALKVDFSATGKVQIGSGTHSTIAQNDGDSKILIGTDYIDYYGHSGGVSFILRKHNNEEGYKLILDEPEEIEESFDWGALAKNVLIGLAIVAAIAACCACPVLLGAVAAGTTLATVCTGAAIGAAVTGTFAIGKMAMDDIAKGEVSSTGDYAKTAIVKGVTGAIEGAITAPFAGASSLLSVEGEVAKVSLKQVGKKLVADQVGNVVLFAGDYYLNATDGDDSNDLTWKDYASSVGTTFFFSSIDVGGSMKTASKYNKQAAKSIDKLADINKNISKGEQALENSTRRAANQKQAIEETEEAIRDAATKGKRKYLKGVARHQSGKLNELEKQVKDIEKSIAKNGKRKATTEAELHTLQETLGVINSNPYWNVLGRGFAGTDVKKLLSATAEKAEGVAKWDAVNDFVSAPISNVDEPDQFDSMWQNRWVKPIYNNCKKEKY